MFFTQYRCSVTIPARTLWVSNHHVFHTVQAFSGYACLHAVDVATPITCFHRRESQTSVGVATPTMYGALGSDAVP